MKNKKGFTLVELIAILILLIVIMLISITAINRQTEKTKIKAFIEEAHTYGNAAYNKYFADKTLDASLREDLYNGNMPGKVCYSIKDNLNGAYVSKSDDKYHGSVEVCYKEGCEYKYKVWLSDGSFYINGKSDMKDKEDVDYNSGTQYFDSCGYESIGSYIGTQNVAEFPYTQSERRITIQKDGLYALEAWGASGGNYPSVLGGYGGYTYSEINLKKGDVLYINVGGKGKDSCFTSDCNGGYNGGASGKTEGNYKGTPGGGMTYITSSKRSLETTTYKNEILVIAGGGGGASSSSRGYSGGGNCSEANRVCTSGTYLGTLANSSCGGGYYGCSSGNSSGGSGYYGPKTKNGVMYCYNCAENSGNQTQTRNTDKVSSNPLPNTAKAGDGYARITYIDGIDQEQTEGILATDFSDYLRVDYIASTKTQYIDTLYKPTPNTGYDIDFSFVDYISHDSRLYIFGTTTTVANPYLSVGYFTYDTGYVDKYGYAFNDGALSENHSEVSCRTYDQQNVKLNVTPGVFAVNDGAVYTTTQETLPTASANNSLYIFANNNIGTANYFTAMKLYGMKIYESGTLVRNFIPCYSKVTHEVGLCDLVTKDFYGNKGTGYFLKGAINNV